VPQDLAAAVRWYRLAADQGDASAQADLGFMYELGQGVKQDFAEAARWYRLAADQGVATAQTALGLLYEGGRGVPQNYVLAHMWFDLSAARGFRHAAELRDLLVDRMTPAQIAEAQKLAREWKPAAGR
jgi:TPR repeat protein